MWQLGGGPGGSREHGMVRRGGCSLRRGHSRAEGGQTDSFTFVRVRACVCMFMHMSVPVPCVGVSL